MDYSLWYDIAEEMNVIGKGNFTPREIAENAYEYLCEWRYSLRTHEVTETIETLLSELKLSDSEYAETIETEIGYWKLGRR